MLKKKSFATFLVLGILSYNVSLAQDDQQMVKLSAGDAPGIKNSLRNGFARATSFSRASVLPFQKAAQERASSNEISPSDSVTRNGEKSLRFELNKTDANVAGKKRCELIVVHEPNSKAERWYSFGVFLPSSFIADKSPEIISQLHANPDTKNGGVWRSPPIAIMTKNGNWYVSVIGAATTDTSNIKDEQRELFDLGPLQNNAWTDWVFHVKWSNDKDGVLEIWENGDKVKEFNGPTIYNKTLGTFWKIGIYKWDWTPGHQTVASTTTKRVVFFDNVKTLAGASSYDDFTKKN